MASSDATSSKDYDSYAQFCLQLAAHTPNRGARVMLREMAAEWLNLWDAGRHAGNGHDGLDGHSLRHDAAN